MKKVIFSLLCVLSFVGVVCARNIENIKEQWTSNSGNINEQFAFDDKYVYVLYQDSITKINKRTGEDYTVNFEYEIFDMIRYKDNIYIMLDYNRLIYKLDRELNIVKKKENVNEYNLYNFKIINNILYSESGSDIFDYKINEDLSIESVVKNKKGDFLSLSNHNAYLYDKNENLLKTVSISNDYYYFSAVFTNDRFYILSTTDYSKGWWHYEEKHATTISVYDKDMKFLYDKNYEESVLCFQDLIVKDGELFAIAYNGTQFLIDLETLDFVNQGIPEGNIFNLNTVNHGDEYDIVYNIDDVAYSEEEDREFSNYFIEYNQNLNLMIKNYDGTYLFTTYDYVNNKDILYVFDKNGNELLVQEFDPSILSNFAFFEQYIVFYDFSSDQKIIFINYDGSLAHVIDVEDKASLYNTNIIVQEKNLFLLRSSSRPRAVAAEDFFEIICFGFEPEMTTKVIGEGNIELDYDKYEVGDVVSFANIPKNGYIVEKVIVKDEFGEELEVQDNKFVMPNSDVTIEVYFVEDVENPNTGVFLKVGIACIITFVCYFFIILKNMKVKQYE